MGGGDVAEHGNNQCIKGSQVMSFASMFNVQRLLGTTIADVIDAMAPGGSGDPYAGLDTHPREELASLYRQGFPRGDEPMIAEPQGQIYLLHEVLPAMKDAGWGRFVHIGSATAKEPEGAIHHALANTTRPSTVGLLKTVADEYAQYGITVNTVAPGWIATDNAIEYIERNLGLATEEERRIWMREQARVPAARMGRPDEIASLIVYLCSDGSGYMTVNWIEVDGGHHRSAF